MRVIDARNINEALPAGLRLLAETGCSRPSRAGDVVVSPVPVAIVYQNPAERVLFWPARDANPFFHVMEGCWMLAGRNDVAFLDRFVRDFGSRFSDDGTTVHGAYGHRWRHWPTLAGGEYKDQLARVEGYLRKFPDGRRAVLTMWDPDRDLYVGEVMRDVPCFGGETVIWSPEGNLPISTLANKFESGEVNKWPVYAVDPISKDMRLTWCTNVWKSGRRKLVRVEFDDGSFVRVTADHILYRRILFGARTARKVSIVPITAGELRPGYRLWAARIWPHAKGYLLHKKKLAGNTSFRNLISVHKEYSILLNGPIPNGIDVHHKNENKQDNRETNLERLDHGVHASLNMFGSDNPSNRRSKEEAKKWGDKHSDKMKTYWAQFTEEERREIMLKRRMISADNHVVTAVYPCDSDDVYDFTVPDLHTAVVGTGIVAHNCNQQVMFNVGLGKRDEPNRLNMMVTCRSGDLIWGITGANAVHFSMLHEYLAAKLGLVQGTFTHVINNFHAYEALYTKLRAAQIDEFLEAPVDPYAAGEVQPYPMVQDPETWDMDLALFMEDPTSNGFRNRWFSRVAKPLYFSHEAWRRKDWDAAFACVDQCVAVDWSRAARQWLERRRK